MERLVRHGLRVVVVEQTETPDMLKQRNDSRAPGTKKVGQARICSTLHLGQAGCGGEKILGASLPITPHRLQLNVVMHR